MTDTTVETPQEKAFFESKGEKEVKQADLLDLPLREPEKAEEEKSDTPVKVEMVPHAAMHQEREKRKAKERELQQERENRARLEGRLGTLEQLARGQQSQPEIPEFEKDPLTNLHARAENTAQQVQTVIQNQQQLNQHQQMQAAHNQFLQTYRMRAQEYTQEKPDFPAAYQHVQSALAKDYLIAGFPQEQVAQLAENMERAIVAKAFQDGANPAERLYAFAENRGYKAKSEAAEAKLDMIAKGQENSKTLSGAGKTAPAKTRLEALANMTDEDFDEATKGSNWKKLFS